MKKIFSDGAWVTGGQIITSLTAFVGMVFLANVLTEEDLGTYRFILSVITILAITTLPGLDTALVRSTAQKYSGQLISTVMTKIHWGLFGSLVSILTASYYWTVGNNELFLLFIIAAFTIPFYGSFFVYFFYLQGHKKFSQSAIINGLCRMIFLLILITGTSLFPTAVGATVSFLLGVILSQMAGFLYIIKNNTEVANPDPDLTSYGKELTLLGAWNIVTVNIDKLLVWFFLGPIALATYAIATLLPLESIRIGRIVSQVLLPRFSEQTERTKNPLPFKPFVIIMFVLVIIWAVFALISPYLFQVFFPKYTEAAALATIAMLLLFSTPSYIARSYFTGIKSQFELRVLLVAVPAIKTIVLALGLWQYGLLGAVWAIAIGGILELLVSLLLLRTNNTKLIQ